MKQMFADVVKDKVDVSSTPAVDSSQYIKQNLMKNVMRSDSVYKAVEEWLFSFQGAMSKDIFLQQMKRLDFDDSKALAQLEKARGKRAIPLPPPPPMPVLERPLLEVLIEDRMVAVFGRAFKSVVKKALAELRAEGTVYVLSVEKLILQFKSYDDKGTAPQMIQDAIECDFLFIADLEIPIHLEWHIVEALERIGRQRKQGKKVILSTWNRFNDCNRFFEMFKIYDIKEQV